MSFGIKTIRQLVHINVGSLERSFFEIIIRILKRKEKLFNVIVNCFESENIKYFGIIPVILYQTCHGIVFRIQ